MDNIHSNFINSYLVFLRDQDSHLDVALGAQASQVPRLAAELTLHPLSHLDGRSDDGGADDDSGDDQERQGEGGRLFEKKTSNWVAAEKIADEIRSSLWYLGIFISL